MNIYFCSETMYFRGHWVLVRSSLVSTLHNRELRFGEKVHVHTPVVCHMSCVTCHMSGVTIFKICYIFFLFFFYNKVVKLVARGFVINGAIPSSLISATMKKSITQVFRLLFRKKTEQFWFKR